MEGGSDDRLKRRHDSISPQTPVEIRKKMRRHARTVHEEEGVDDVDDVMPARLASKRKVEKHPSKAAAVLAKAAKKGIDSDDDGEVPSIPGTANPRQGGDTLYQTPPKLKATRSVFEEATLDRHHASSGGDASLVLPPPARVLTEEEMERRRRRRNSKTFQSRRKSLTPNAKTKQYVSEMYSTIIKMSSENVRIYIYIYLYIPSTKINSKNSWSLHLIDHIDDILSGKRHDDEPADSAAATDTYNFQKASCTLDASVKIYSYRVDDTWNSSFKVLENLTRGDEQDGGGGGDGDDDDDDRAERRTTSKKLTVANTIETNLKHINMKSVDLEFQVDPLFQKSVHNGCKIVLDSSNVKAASNTPADGHAAAEDDDGADDKPPRKMINISGLTKRLRASATVVE
ncbi:hypothetical protein AaE_002966, partial [Aphanomyces astaci]